MQIVLWEIEELKENTQAKKLHNLQKVSFDLGG